MSNGASEVMGLYESMLSDCQTLGGKRASLQLKAGKGLSSTMAGGQDPETLLQPVWSLDQ